MRSTRNGNGTNERKMIYMMLVPKTNFDIFDDFFDDPFFNVKESKIMKTDIKEHEGKYELLIDLPGYNKEDIKLHIEDGYLIVNAKTSKEDNEKDDKGKYVRKERFYGECSRSYFIGKDITEDDIKANFKNGTLMIEVPKQDQIENKKEKKYNSMSGLTYRDMIKNINNYK